MSIQNGIQAVIFDVGGVLDVSADRTHANHVIEQIATELGMGQEEMWSHFYRTETWKLARTGKITDQEFWNRNLTPLGITEPAVQAALAERLMSVKQVAPAMRDLLDELLPCTRLGIISNASDTLEETLKERFGIEHYFQLVINSARVGCAKPDPEIYRIALKKLDLPAEETVFIDDQQHNVDAAIELGIHATLFEDVVGLRAFLVSVRVLDA